MSGFGDWGDVVERLKRAIVGQFGTLAAFARKLEMDPTQLSATLRPHRRPEPETLDRFSVALGWEPSRLRQWYGYEVGHISAPPPPPLPIEGDRPFDPAQIVAFVESKPDPKFQAQLARAKARRTPERYVRLCLRINRAWSSNADLVMEELEAIEAE